MNALPGQRRNTFSSKRISNLKAQLNSQVLFIGRWIRYRAVKSLSVAAQSGNQQAIEVLAAAISQPQNVQVIQAARKALFELQDQKALNTLWAIWSKDHPPELVELLRQKSKIADNPLKIKVLICLELDQNQLLLGAITVEPLTQFCHDPDPDLRRKAEKCLLKLKSQAAIDDFCGFWASSRDENLTKILIQAHYIARKPLQIHLLSALKNGKVDPITKVGADGVSDLLSACDDLDSDIAHLANECLFHLEDPEAQDRLCCLFNENGSGHACNAALHSKYLPLESSQKGLFFFLTEQWEKYLSFDFDLTYLRTIFQVSSRELRQTIADTLQASGRTDLLVIMTGADASLTNGNIRLRNHVWKISN